MNFVENQGKIRVLLDNMAMGAWFSKLCFYNTQPTMEYAEKQMKPQGEKLQIQNKAALFLACPHPNEKL